MLNRELIAFLRRGKSVWLLLFYLLASSTLVVSLWGRLAADPLNRTDVSHWMFRYCSVVQVAMCGLFGAVIGSGWISSERRRKTFDLLVMVPLRAHEILLGKAFASVGFVLLLVVAAIPIWSLCFLLGGVSGGEFVRTFYLSILTAVTYSMLGVGWSARSARHRSMELWTIFCWIALLNDGLAVALALFLHFVAGLPDPVVSQIAVTISFLFSPLSHCHSLMPPLPVIGPLNGVHPLALHTLGEAGVFLFFLWLGCRGLRKESARVVAHAQSPSIAAKAQSVRLAFVRLFPIPSRINPVAAKDVLLAIPKQWAARILCLVVALAVVGFGAWLIITSRSRTSADDDLATSYVICAAIAAGLTWLLCYLRGSGVVASEAEADTLPMLATTALEPQRVMSGKLLAVLVTVAGPMVVLGLALAAVFCACYPATIANVVLSIPLVVVSMVLGGAVFGSLGLIISAGAPSVRSASTRAGLLLVGLFCCAPFSFIGGGGMAVLVAFLVLPGSPLLLPEGLMSSSFWLRLALTVTGWLFNLGIAMALLVSAADVYSARIRKDQERARRS